MAFTGWEWDHVAETLDAQRLAQLAHQWRRVPPLPLMVAAYLEAGMFSKDAAPETQREVLPPPPAPGDAPPEEQNDHAAIRQLMQMLGVSPPPPKAP